MDASPQEHSASEHDHHDHEGEGEHDLSWLGPSNMLLLLSLAMFAGAFLAGYIPMFFSVSQQKYKAAILLIHTYH